ncbi:MAG: nitroreductase family protein [Clostridiales bacterium]|nr:nitroreductase family protein [Clostridiales bacterium]
MSDILELIKSRRSVKKYKSDPVPKELIEKIVEAGTYAPTGRNWQSPIILAVTNKEIRDELSRLNFGYDSDKRIDPFYGAPCVLVVLADKSKHTYVYDGSLVMGNMLLEAHSLGLGACWIHRAKETFESAAGKAILKKLGIEGDYEGIGNCIVGYPDMTPVDKPRKENWVYYID